MVQRDTSMFKNKTKGQTLAEHQEKYSESKINLAVGQFPTTVAALLLPRLILNTCKHHFHLGPVREGFSHMNVLGMSPFLWPKIFHGKYFKSMGIISSISSTAFFFFFLSSNGF